MMAKIFCVAVLLGALAASQLCADSETPATVFPSIRVGEKTYLPEPGSILDDSSDIAVSVISAKEIGYGRSVFLVKVRNASDGTRSVVLKGAQGQAKPSTASVDLLPGVSADLELKLQTVNAAETPFRFEIVHNRKTIRAASYVLWVPPPMHTVVVDSEVPVGTKLIKWTCEWLSIPAPDRLTVRMELHMKGNDQAITAIDCICYKGRKLGAFTIPQLGPGQYVIESKYALKGKPICTLKNEFSIVEPTKQD